MSLIIVQLQFCAFWLFVQLRFSCGHDICFILVVSLRKVVNSCKENVLVTVFMILLNHFLQNVKLYFE